MEERSLEIVADSDPGEAGVADVTDRTTVRVR
jgi:hypothetical protein